MLSPMNSRADNDASDWKLCPRVFYQINKLWPVKLDLFASAWNSQLDSFISWKPQPDASAVDAFSVSWKNRFAYAFPPFSMIARCLNKIMREKSEIVLVAPVWPGQPWYPLLLELTFDVPRILPSSHQLLTSPLGAPHPLSDQLTLAVWRLSGNLSAGEEFRDKWSTFYWPVTAEPLILPMSLPGSLGLVGVWRGRQIPCQMI